MTDLIDGYMKTIAVKLAKPQNIPYFPGLYHGKTGIAVFLSHYASYTKNDSYNEMAFDLISKIDTQLYGNNSVNYAYGLSGIGAGIEYLVQHAYFEADTDEVLEDIDISVSNHLTDYSVLSSFNQIKDIGKYLSFRMKTTKREPEIKDSIERVVNLIEMQLMRTPLCCPDVLGLLYAFRNISEKASVLFADNIKLFDIRLVKEFPFECFYFFQKTKKENQNSNVIDSIDQLILDKQLNLTNMEYILWASISGNNITDEQLSGLIYQCETVQNFSMIDGLTGIGLTLLTLADKQNVTWIELL
jgi:hypothetical protein